MKLLFDMNFGGNLISRIADFLRFARTIFHEFEFQVLPLKTNFHGSWAGSCPVFHIKYLPITTKGCNAALFTLLIYCTYVASCELQLKAFHSLLFDRGVVFLSRVTVKLNSPRDRRYCYFCHNSKKDDRNIVCGQFKLNSVI